MAATSMPPAPAEGSLAGGSTRLFEPGGVTLEDVVLDAWQDLVAEGRTGCPVCGADMRPTGCTGCGSELS